jgi:hypothetical protein
VDQVRLARLLNTLDYFITVAYVTVLAKVGRKKDTLRVPKRATVVTDFCVAVSFTIAALSDYSAIFPINSEFVSLLDLIGAHSDAEMFHPIYGTYLQALLQARPIGRFRAPQESIAAPALRLALVSIQEIAINPAFLESLGRFDSGLSGLFSDIYRQSFATGDTDTIRTCTIVFSEVARRMESAGSAVPLIAAALFPIFSVSAIYRNHVALTRDITAAEHFAIVVLVLLSSFPPDEWLNHFSVFTDDQQALAIDLLGVLFLNLLRGPEMPDIPLGLAHLSDRASEFVFLRSVATISRRHLHYPLIHEVTHRMLVFVTMMLSQLEKFRPPLLFSVVRLLGALLDGHQLRQNYQPVLVVIARVISAHEDILFEEHNYGLDTLVALGFTLGTRQLQTAKAAGVALLVHILFRDYCVTGNLLICGYHFDEQFINHVWALPVYKMEALQGMIETLLPFVRDFVRPHLVNLAEGQVRRLAVIANCIGDKTLDRVFENQPQISQLFASLPLQMVHYLAILANESVNAGALAAAFNFQLQIVAVIWGALKEANVKAAHRFRFDPILRVKLCDLSVYAPAELKYVIGTDEISIERLTQALQGAIEFGEKSGFEGPAAILREIYEDAQ